MVLTRHQAHSIANDQCDNEVDRLQSKGTERKLDSKTKHATEPDHETSSSGSSSESDQSDSDENEDSSDSSDEESDDEDLKALLTKAREALRTVPKDEMDNEEIETKDKYSLPSIDTTGTQEGALYIKTAGGKAQLLQDQTGVITSKPSEAPATAPTFEDETPQPAPPRLSRKERKRQREQTSGKGWFDMPRPDITPEVKRDLDVLKMRHVLDRKRHYRKLGKEANPTYFQMGTIIEGPTEFFSSRLNKADRKQTLVEEVLSNTEGVQYYKRKYSEAQDRATSGGKKHYKKMQSRRNK